MPWIKSKCKVDLHVLLNFLSKITTMISLILSRIYIICIVVVNEFVSLPNYINLESACVILFRQSQVILSYLFVIFSTNSLDYILSVFQTWCCTVNSSKHEKKWSHFRYMENCWTCICDKWKDYFKNDYLYACRVHEYTRLEIVHII